MILKILNIKNPILRNKSLPVKKIDKKIKKLIADMKETLLAQKDPEGVGLAAPQVGKNLQIFIINYENTKLKTIINPKVIKITNSKTRKQKTKKSDQILEGCLSLPYIYGPLQRADKIKISYIDENSKKVIEEFTGFTAQIVQHEMDHLQGKLFIDHLISEKKPIYRIKGNEWEKIEL